MSGSGEIAAVRTITDEAAIKIQTLWRGHATRKAFSLPKRTFVSHYHLLPLGNDPELSTCTPPIAHTADKFALISTSTLKAIETGLEIGGGISIPKIYIVDYSKDVYDFWIAIKKIFLTEPPPSTDELEYLVLRDIYTLPAFIESCIKTGCNPGNSHRFNVAAYLEKLIQKYNFKCVQKSISNLCPILGSWTDKELLLKLNNILDALGFTTRFLAPTNILACITIVEKLPPDLFFESIESLKPTGQIHSDLGFELYPKNLYFFPQTATSADIFRRVIAGAAGPEAVTLCATPH